MGTSVGDVLLTVAALWKGTLLLVVVISRCKGEFFLKKSFLPEFSSWQLKFGQLVLSALFAIFLRKKASLLVPT